MKRAVRTVGVTVAAVAMATALVAPAHGLASSYSDVVLVNGTGTPVEVQVDGNPALHLDASTADGSVAMARLPEGPHDVSIAGTHITRTTMPVDGGCATIWVIAPSSAPSPVVAFPDCPPRRVQRAGTASVRFVNAAVNAPTMVMSSPSASTTPTGPWSASARIDVSAGAVPVSLRRSDTGTAVRTITVALEPGQGYAAVLTGGGEVPVAFQVVADAGAQPVSPPDPRVPVDSGMRRKAKPPKVPATPVTTVPVTPSIPAGSRGTPGGALPARVRVGAIDTTVVAIPSDSMSTLPRTLPLDTAGWVQGTSVPGASGTAWIVGHNTFTGTGAFHALDDVMPGDVVTVTTDANIDLLYRVEDTFAVEKGDLPDELIGPSLSARLVLISCTGPRSSSGLHSMNRVVIASASPQPAL